MTIIERVFAREVLDSRGKPTVEAEVRLANGVMGTAIAPSGASTGSAEACELRDGDPERYDGQGVLRAVRNVNEIIAPVLIGEEVDCQEKIDCTMSQLDGTPNKSNLGANAILAVSLAVAQAAAAAQGQPLFAHLSRRFAEQRPQIPVPMTNMISGGKHAGGNLDFQDILIQPIGAPDYATGLEWIVRVYRRLGKLLGEAGYEGYLVGDEGGYGPRLKGNREAVEFVVRAIEAAKLQPGEQVTIAIDVAATHFYRDGFYHLAAEQGKKLSSSELVDRLEQWVNDFPITSIEDGLAEEDWTGWQELTARLGKRAHIVGDDLFATNCERIEQGIAQRAGNAVLIKMNQIGTLSETLAAVRLAKRAGFAIIVSARSGESEDTFMSDLAVAVAADRIKVGSIARSERLAKYNRLLRIAEMLK
ncbi:phosphopyruvate hydratase [Anatilimnocola sp. NA78]|uniref:phosphopyruvate hydratase n=1 Tax=Anatilimnocola sp. NA78 TaxID=3415683 RepID=UPI003CE53FB9